MKRILCSISTFAHLDPQCVQSWYDIKVPDEYSFRIEFITGYGAAVARNKAVCKALAQKYDYLMFFDADQIAPPDTLEKLLECKADIASGWILIYSKGGKNWTNIMTKEDPLGLKHNVYTQEKLPKGIFKAYAVGGGCMLVNIDVFRKLKYPYFTAIEYENGGRLSDDSHFCRKMRELNIPIMVNANLKVGHVRTHVI